MGLRPALAEEVPATGSDFGGVGLIETRNARLREDGTLEAGASLRHQRRFFFLNFQALPFLEGTFRLSERLNGTTGSGTTTDRALDLKLRLLAEGEWNPALAIGLQDLIGTGIYAGEYLVASKRWNRFDLSLGLGWGRLGTGEDLRNPLAALSGRFEDRRRSVGRGGTLRTDLFGGGSVSLFGGVEYSIPALDTPFGVVDGLRAKLEWSGDDLRDERGGYPARTEGLRGRAATRLNAGLQWSNDTIDAGVSFVHGTDLLFRVSFRLDPADPPRVPRPPPPALAAQPVAAGQGRPSGSAGGYGQAGLSGLSGPVAGGTLVPGRAAAEAGAEATLPQRLFAALTAAGFRPLAVALDGAEARIAVADGPFRTLAQVAARVARAAEPILPPQARALRVSWWLGGAEVAQVLAPRDSLLGPARGTGSPEEAFADTVLLPATGEGWPGEVRAPDTAFTYALEPRLALILGDPSRTMRWQAGAAAGARLQLGAGFGLAGAVQQVLAGNLDEGLPSDSRLPHVRSDYALYARDGKTSIPALYAERIWNLAPDVFARATAGLLEPMFGGVSTEALWRPSGASWAVGLDLNWVRQRDTDGRFGFRNYSVTTGHASLYADLPVWNLYAVLRAGRYLAGDWGATLELGRRFDSGIEVGGFATLTDVPFSRFGEGSFDKGIYVRFPLDLLGANSRAVGQALIRPVQRDGGQRLAVDNPLWTVTRDGRADALRRGVSGFAE
ncbi:YjbH domain-containing protein [Roseomonas sp. BN140053]|uniref:YjbH domain-containing protein n=1 Tax=Roseomonas sp. BN140053 TaxID=3391898 RepID=UPI0039EB8BF2